jgi:hypothetical protein
VGEVFIVKLFSPLNEAMLYQGEYKDGKEHKLLDAPDISLHQQKSRFANLQTFVF